MASFLLVELIRFGTFKGAPNEFLGFKAIRIFIYVFNNLLIKHSVAYAYNHG